MLHRHFAGGCLALLLLGAPAAQAAMNAPLPTGAPAVHLAAAVCPPGYHFDVSGVCVDSMDYSRSCPPGTFALSFPNGNGYRCADGMAAS